MHLCISPHAVASLGEIFQEKTVLKKWSTEGPSPPQMVSNFLLFVEAELLFICLFIYFLVVDSVGLKLERNMHITKAVIHKSELAATTSSACRVAPSSACRCFVPKWCHTIDVHLADLSSPSFRN